MAEIKIVTDKARHTFRRPKVVGYRWIGDVEYEMLDCGHERPAEMPYSLDYYEDEEFETEYLADEPARRDCKECPVPKGWDR